VVPSHFTQANDVLLSNGPGVADLPIFRNVEENTVTSLWIPTDEERAIIANGGAVLFMCMGRTHPPIWLGAAGLAPSAGYRPDGSTALETPADEAS
jgi:hypothetical protein